MPKFVGQKATIMTGGTKLWKAVAKHVAPFGTWPAPSVGKYPAKEHIGRIFRALWWKVANRCKLGFWI